MVMPDRRLSFTTYPIRKTHMNLLASFEMSAFWFENYRSFAPGKRLSADILYDPL